MQKTDVSQLKVHKVKFAKDRREALIKYLGDQHSAVFSERDSMLPKWQNWVKQANSRLKRTDAGPRDSNLDMTLTRERMMQNAARLQTPIFQQDQIMVAQPRTAGPETHDLALAVEGMVDYILDRSEAMKWSDDWVKQFQMFPYGAVKTAFIREVKNVKRWEEIEEEDYEALKEIDEENVVERKLEDGTVKWYREVPSSRVEREGCFPEVIPAEDFIFPDAPNPDAAPWVTHRIWMSREAIAFRIREGVYESKTPDGDKILDVLGNPSGDHKPLLGIHEKEKEDTASATRRYEVLETYLSYDVDGKGVEHEIIVTWERNSKIIFRAVHNFYHAYHRPFVVHQYDETCGSMYGTPMTYFLEPLHRAYSASINQRLDAASKANETMVLLPPAHPLLDQMDRTSVRGGFYENPGYSKDEIIQFRISEPSFSQLPQLEQIFEHRADRISNLSPGSYGEETAERPTATGTVQVLEEARQPQYLQLERYRKAFAKVVWHMLARYRQFFPEGLAWYVEQETPEDVEIIRKFFSWPDEALEEQVIIETKVSSSTMSKSLRKQEVVSMLDKVPQIYQVMMQLSQLASDPMNPASMTAMKLLVGLQAIFEKFLKEFDIGEKGAVNPDLSQGVNYGAAMAQLQQQIQMAGQQIQKLQAENAQQKAVLQGAPPGMAGPPPGAPGMAGPPGMAGGPA